MLKALVADDSRVIRTATTRVFTKLGIATVEAADGPGAVEAFVSQRPDFVLVDVEMPGLDGYEVVRRIRAMGEGRWVPVIFMSSMEGDEDLRSGIEAGGDDYLAKPVSAIVLEAKVRALWRLDTMRRELLTTTDQLRAANARLEHLAQMDGLTELANRRLFDLILLREFGCARRNQRPIALVMCDIDHFKLFNDTYGHLGGDDCLRRVSAAIRETCRRPGDLAARYGGEEFALILPDTPAESAERVARKLREAVERLAIRHAGSKTAPVVTMSLGVASEVPGPGLGAQDLVRLSDEALYRAKAEGRNRVVRGGRPSGAGTGGESATPLRAPAAYAST